MILLSLERLLAYLGKKSPSEKIRVFLNQTTSCFESKQQFGDRKNEHQPQVHVPRLKKDVQILFKLHWSVLSVLCVDHVLCSFNNRLICLPYRNKPFILQWWLSTSQRFALQTILVIKLSSENFGKQLVSNNAKFRIQSNRFEKGVESAVID